ncbi:MAG: dihydropteroate synthase [Paludibacter sp.]
MLLNYSGRIIDLHQPMVMGILNVTPDSFFNGSRVGGAKHAHKVIEKMLLEGVDIVDIGAYSSRPQADDVSTNDEINRLSDVLEMILKNFPDLPLSVDTFRSAVAQHVVKNYGVGIINDISGGTLDSNMFETVAELGVAYVLMHMKGNPQTMQTMSNYDNVVSEVIGFLHKRISQLNMLGVKDIIIDPGFGFAKTTAQNYELLKNLDLFQVFEKPMLVGVSRKSMIYKTLDCTPDNALNGTTAVHVAALMAGAKILRVHDVKEAKEAVAIYEAMC